MSSVIFVIFFRQLLRNLAAIPAPLVAGDCGAEAFAAGCPASPTPPRDRRRNRRNRHSRCSFTRRYTHLFLHPSLSPSVLLPFHPSLPPRCFPPLAFLAVDMSVFSTCYCCHCCLPLLLSFLQLLLRLLMQPLLRPASVQRIAFENATFCVQLTFMD